MSKPILRCAMQDNGFKQQVGRELTLKECQKLFGEQEKESTIVIEDNEFIVNGIGCCDCANCPALKIV